MNTRKTTRDSKDSSESVVRKKTVKDVGMDKDKVDIKLKKEKKSKNNVFKYKNDKGEITVAHFSNNEEDENLINDGNEGLTMFCNRCLKEVEKMILAKHAMINYHQFVMKKRKY